MSDLKEEIIGIDGESMYLSVDDRGGLRVEVHSSDQGFGLGIIVLDRAGAERLRGFCDRYRVMCLGADRLVEKILDDVANWKPQPTD